MFAVEIMHAMNAITNCGYTVSHNGGIIRVEHNDHPTIIVDVRNPLLDKELAWFHRSFRGIPKSVRDRVEEIASQFRRIASQGGGNWGAAIDEAAAKGGHQPTIHWPRQVA